ncbi:MAG: LL-diaminopimelate aminotransferase [Simkaniaceae bacterium]|nr:LL-diaminopimelate aminotransferase [Simkaniaceae bacterium]MCF7852483.1 LL-diaminopimelate aminotransferase [Simkaniaceae bacterium]
MAHIKDHLQTIETNYIFSFVSEQKRLFDPKQLIDLGIGDIAYPLNDFISNALQKATQEMAGSSKLYGYGPECGYLFLKEAILSQCSAYHSFTPDEVIITDGIATPITLFPLLMHPSTRFAIQSPSYPAYLEIMKLQGTAPSHIELLPAQYKETLSFPLPTSKVDVIYLCSPHNPTGIALTRQELKQWVEYAKQNDALILYDGAYQAFITRDEVPSSIYEIEGADEVALEFCSFSKSAGFTGLRCGYFICPQKIHVRANGHLTSLLKLVTYARIVTSNGVAYPVQKAAEMALSFEGKKHIGRDIAKYHEATAVLKEGLNQLGFTSYGGIDCPYIWWKIPTDQTSISFFEFLLNQLHIVAVPGSGFGKDSEGYMRLSGLTTIEKATQAIQRLTTTYREVYAH